MGAASAVCRVNRSQHITVMWYMRTCERLTSGVCMIIFIYANGITYNKPGQRIPDSDHTKQGNAATKRA